MAFSFSSCTPSFSKFVALAVEVLNYADYIGLNKGGLFEFSAFGTLIICGQLFEVGLLHTEVDKLHSGERVRLYVAEDFIAAKIYEPLRSQVGSWHYYSSSVGGSVSSEP